MSKNEITGDTLASKVGDKTAYQNYCDSWDRIFAKKKILHPCPNCGAEIRAKGLYEGGGLECSEKCGYWFCY